MMSRSRLTEPQGITSGKLGLYLRASLPATLWISTTAQERPVLKVSKQLQQCAHRWRWRFTLPRQPHFLVQATREYFTTADHLNN